MPANGRSRPSSPPELALADPSALSRPRPRRHPRPHPIGPAMPASQHQNPKSDIEIAQAAQKRPIMDIAREKLGIAPENLEPFGHYKAKVSMDFIKSLKDKPNGKLILVTAVTPTPAGEGKTTTTVGL